MFLLKWPHRLLLLPKWKSDSGSGTGFSQIFDSGSGSGSERKRQNPAGVDSGNPDPAPPLIYLCANEVLNQMLGDFVKMTLAWVIDCDSSRVILIRQKTWLESNDHRFSTWLEWSYHHFSTWVESPKVVTRVTLSLKIIITDICINISKCMIYKHFCPLLLILNVLMYSFRKANVPLGVHVPQFGNPWSRECTRVVGFM